MRDRLSGFQSCSVVSHGREIPCRNKGIDSGFRQFNRFISSCRIALAHGEDRQCVSKVAGALRPAGGSRLGALLKRLPKGRAQEAAEIADG